MYQIPIPLLMALTVFGGNQGREGQVIKQAFPAMLSGPAGFVLAVHAARKQLEQQDEENKEIIQQVIDTVVIPSEEELSKKFDKLHAMFVKLPEGVRTKIKFRSAAPL